MRVSVCCWAPVYGKGWSFICTKCEDYCAIQWDSETEQKLDEADDAGNEQSHADREDMI